MNRSLAVFLAAGLLSFAAAPRAEECKLALVMDLPMRLVNGRPMVDGAINGKKVNVLIHTAAYASLVTNDAAAKLDLQVTSNTRERFSDGRRVGATRLDELRIGPATVRGMTVRVGVEGWKEIDFILGSDFLGKYDVEFDYAANRIRLFQASRCVGQSLAYWDRNAQQVGLARDDRIIVPVVVNGTRARARLDTGTPSTALTAQFAKKLGKAPKSPGVLPAGCGHGNEPKWMTRLDTVEIANQVTRDARVYVAAAGNMPDDAPDVYLGNDFLAAHRVLVARSRGTMYFSHVGGQVFRAYPQLACDPRFAGKKREEQLASVNAALATDPLDVSALLHRADLQSRDEPRAALADLDAAIAREPANPAALAMRSYVRLLLRDPSGALADSDAALEQGMVGANPYVMRGQIRRSQRDEAGAMQEYAQALRLDPRHTPAFRVRGRVHYYAGRLDEAEKDFMSALAIRANGYDSMWLAIVRSRRGADGRPALEEGRSRLEGDEWPAPVLDHLLGRIDQAALMDAAARQDRKDRACEARFYAAMRLWLNGNAAEARPLLEKGAEGCPGNYLEYEAALLALK